MHQHGRDATLTISAAILRDSIGPSGRRITTFLLRYPRFIHAEFMTHRVFSRNASSSRAIPFQRALENIKADPAMPIRFGKNRPGMQATSDLSQEAQREAEGIWLAALEGAITYAQKLHEMGVHKQLTNRILEPFSHITVVCTATEFDNFFALRHHPAAQPEIYDLADKMAGALKASSPTWLALGEWHLPFIADDDPNDIDIKLKRSVARCARTSYLTHDNKETTLAKDVELFERLITEEPMHASPAEHQAQAVADSNFRSGNFTGWLQYRKVLEQ